MEPSEPSSPVRRLRPNTKIQVFNPEKNRWKIWDVFPGRDPEGEPDPEHMEVMFAALSGKGHAHWNEWRAAHPSIQPNLARVEFAIAATSMGQVRGVNLSGYDLSDAIMRNCSLAFANLIQTRFSKSNLREALINQSKVVKSDFSDADLTQASMSSLECIGTKFRGADLTRALLHDSNLFGCDFDGADLEDAELETARLNGSSFRGAQLLGTRCGSSNLGGCSLAEADLSGAHLVRTDLAGADLTRARVYGLSCWDVTITDETTQRDLVVTQRGSATISVDDIRVAQFVHLILNNANLRGVLDSVTKKGVLILGRFGGGGIDVLRTVADALRAAQYLPMIFDFERPDDRNYTETVRTLAGLARFVVVDLSGPSVPQELYATVPHLKIPFVPILEKGRQPYAMFRDLLEYQWVLGPIVDFTSPGELRDLLQERIIAPAEKWVEARRARLTELMG
jgi:uncharacterized protein YjbI with pentapeptide repeats